MLQDQSRNRTPMPGAQAPAAAPPDTGPARAEAGIAAMLAAQAGTVADPDAELIEIGGHWPGLVAAYLGYNDRIHDIEELNDEPDRPKELKVFSFDIFNGFPETKWLPYGAEHIEELRAVPRVAVYVSSPRGGIRRPDGTLLNINEAAQRRADSIVEAWDRWQAEIKVYEAKYDLPTLNAALYDATVAYDAAILRARAVPARTFAGLLVKARIAAQICGLNFEVNEDALDEYAILKSVLADLLKIGEMNAAPIPPLASIATAALRPAETDLARMVVDYFGPEPIDPVLTGDIALRDRARAILAAAQSDATPDPIFAALAEAQRLDAVWHAISDEWKLDTQEPPELEARRGAALEGFWDHWNETVLKTVPITAAGCAALSRYVVEYLDRDEVDLNEGPEGVNHDVLRLIMRSPMLGVGQAATDAPDFTADTDTQLTMEEAAAYNFEGYKFPEAVRNPLEWSNEFSSHGLSMHLGDRLLRMNKTEMVEFIRGAVEKEEETVDVMYKLLTSSSETFDGWGKLLNLVATRYLIAGSTLGVERQAEEAV